MEQNLDLVVFGIECVVFTVTVLILYTIYRMRGGGIKETCRAIIFYGIAVGTFMIVNSLMENVLTSTYIVEQESLRILIENKGMVNFIATFVATFIVVLVLLKRFHNFFACILKKQLNTQSSSKEEKMPLSV